MNRIAEEVTQEVRQRGFKRVGLLGTRFLMEGPVHPSKLASASIDHQTPNTAQRQRINQIIYDELVRARFLPSSLAYFQNVIHDLASDCCDAVALACTEIPLLVGEAESELPILDSTRILARAAIRVAVTRTRKTLDFWDLRDVRPTQTYEIGKTPHGSLERNPWGSARTVGRTESSGTHDQPAPNRYCTVDEHRETVIQQRFRSGSSAAAGREGSAGRAAIPS
jgi:Asp/Glu/Hydantoin racemase